MAKIAVIADNETVLGFKANGIETHVFKNEKELHFIFNNIKNNEYEVIFISEKAYIWLEKELKIMMESPVPAITVIPSAGENLGVADDFIKDIVLKAVGTKIG